ncbi:sigma-w pathway protein ysdB [Gracilibacillus salitolerans]|uniref:Sigma-w pathway protein ysdB n=1 Tax=Gracilibacillus salitolerans TaxID=2663022 RepID=A0A5Q2TM85_9BACI|nr:sigma-w pathway protein ysdB [Gracilibacillus salitolerans]QGH35261.1 sigma-w pathway protein ysdB [Gracilibacillus salitolerans]
MIVILFRFLVVIAMIVLIYTAYKYIVNPKRKLEVAQEKSEFYFLDYNDNIKKNFFITYKGFLFEGEKYLGTTEEAFEVINIVMHTRNPEKLKGFERKDLYFLEEEILIRYPHAEIEWKYPINKLHLK